MADRNRIKGSILSSNLRGALWLLLASVLFSIMVVFIKLLDGRISVFQIIFVRQCLAVTLLAPLFVRHGTDVWRTQRPMLHVFRGVVGLAGMSCGFYAVALLPLADVTAISFTRSLFMPVMAIVILHEVVGPRRWSAIAIGFLGVLIMLRPGADGIGPAATFAILSAVLASLASICIRLLARTETTVSMMGYPAVVIALGSLGPALVTWITPTWHDMHLLGLVALFGTLGQWCLIPAFRHAETGVLAPVDYSRLVFAAVFGFVVFAEVPSPSTLAGALLIVLSTLYIVLREQQVARTAAHGRP